MNTTDKLSIIMAGEKQRLGKLWNPHLEEAIIKLIAENKMIADRLPIITENDGAYE